MYLKLKPNNQVAVLIRDFNLFLKKDYVFNQYHIQPFLNTHPLHITLYLTVYKEQHIPRIIKRSRIIAKQEKALPITSKQFISSNGGYVMLTIQPSKQLRHLSNKAVIALSDLRDKKAPIPHWAAQNAQRRQLFQQYGSPGVLHYFNPHCSIFDRGVEDIELQKRLNQLIYEFGTQNNTQVTATAYAIGIGLADKQGQIIQELMEFTL